MQLQSRRKRRHNSSSRAAKIGTAKGKTGATVVVAMADEASREPLQ